MTNKTMVLVGKLLNKLPWLEIALISSLGCLVLLYFEPELTRWWNSPSPGRIGVDYLDGDFNGSGISEACLLGLPPAYRQQDDWPLLIFLHGSGHRGNDPQVLRETAHRLASSYDEEMPAVMLLPQCRSQCSWRAGDIRRFITVAKHRYQIDPHRIYLVGYSMGGYGTWEAATLYPDCFAAIVPIAGGGNRESASNLVNVPCWAFHGEKDTVVSATGSIDMVRAIQAEGGSAKLTLYPDVGHGLYHRVFSEPELWGWLFEQNLQNRKSPPAVHRLETSSKDTNE